ncbi:hypothetical protein CK489_13255 [Bradyrhizobium sp. UFLA03-84]|nr:hypothetical protein CK489_13255 [Bradyrhizobium sp. UFLA03-84]
MIWAACSDHPAIVEALLAKDTALELRDSDGRTALILAAVFGHISIVRPCWPKVRPSTPGTTLGTPR